ncbi:MAG: hypothetical protein AAFY98_01395 [Verrucomicrobiota bacterium]
MDSNSRAITTIVLPQQPDGLSLLSAQLRISTNGHPLSNEWAETLEIFHATDQDHLKLTETSYSDTSFERIESTCEIDPTDPTNLIIDVTSAVKRDYVLNSERSITTFRLQSDAPQSLNFNHDASELLLVFGTEPAPKIELIGNQPCLEIETNEEKCYRVFISDSPVGPFSNISEFDGDGTLTELIDSSGLQTKRFYRVEEFSHPPEFSTGLRLPVRNLVFPEDAQIDLGNASLTLDVSGDIEIYCAIISENEITISCNEAFFFGTEASIASTALTFQALGAVTVEGSGTVTLTGSGSSFSSSPTIHSGSFMMPAGEIHLAGGELVTVSGVIATPEQSILTGDHSEEIEIISGPISNPDEHQGGTITLTSLEPSVPDNSSSTESPTQPSPGSTTVTRTEQTNVIETIEP